jgi:hypothetical protein
VMVAAGWTEAQKRLGDAVHAEEGAADGGAGTGRAAPARARGVSLRRFE